jgi:A/G-specific adenine glycosylase
LSSISPTALRRTLLDWYDRHRRPLPWRDNTDPYRVLVSEVMLQQTRAETVGPYFERWTTRFPTVEALAESDQEEVLGLWSGLGYYSRARNLHRTAMIVADQHDGRIPDTVEALRELPGVGEYTAGAVASIAFGRCEPAVDGNVRRVLSRLFDLEAPRPSELRELAAKLVPSDRPGDFNQALMELGARVCRPRSPDCQGCPLQALCLSHARGTVDLRPAPRPRTSIPTYTIGTAVIVSANDQTLFTRRPDNGLLGGMWEYPGLQVNEGEESRAAAGRVTAELFGDVVLESWPDRGELTEITHTFSHRRHHYHAFGFRIDGEPVPDLSSGNWTEARWCSTEGSAELPLPAAQRKLAQIVAAIEPTGAEVPC